MTPVTKPPGTGPTFLYVGAPKAGSTWLFHALRQHPDVFVPEAKGLEFFDANYDRGIEWYRRCFADACGAVARGELSHDYYASPAAAERIRRHLPETRLILCLREPADFAVSVLRWWVSHTVTFGDSVDEMAEHPHFRGLIDYRANLERLYALFDAGQILVLFYEDLCDRPDRFLSDVYGFIGVSSDFRPPVLEQRINPTRPPRSRPLLRSSYLAAHVLKRAGASSFVESLKHSRLVDSLLYRDSARRSGTSPEERRIAEVAAAVRQDVAQDYEAIARMLGRRLPEAWLDPAGG